MGPAPDLGPPPDRSPRPAERVAPSPPLLWDSVLSALESKRGMLAGHYQHARVLSFTADNLEVGFPEEAAMSGELCREPEQINAMKQFLRDHFSRSMNLSVRLLTAAESAQAPARSIVEATREKAVEERKKREAEAREHPATKLVLETFGAQIKEIKTDV